MVVASLPFSIFLIHGIIETFKEIILKIQHKSLNNASLYIFSLCWLLSVFLFFSISATKLTSYWIPAIPAASILISRSAQILMNKKRDLSLVWFLTTLILFGFSVAFYFSDGWLALIKDPEMPNLSNQIKNYGLIHRATYVFAISTILSIYFIFRFLPKSVLYLQIFFFSGQFLLMPFIRELADQLRQLPIRNISEKIIIERSLKEPLAMIGIRKPSLHFYSKQIVFYESSSRVGLVNLAERFNFGKRVSVLDEPNYESDSFLVVIDKYSKKEKHWNEIRHEKLGVYGIYSLLRVKRNDLNLYANKFKEVGIKPSWQIEKYEKF
tara:strand:- start:273 stop:1244 length:972 start_codon:yes stop_codon:yes gene_type:complete